MIPLPRSAWHSVAPGSIRRPHRSYLCWIENARRRWKSVFSPGDRKELWIHLQASTCFTRGSFLWTRFRLVNFVRSRLWIFPRIHQQKRQMSWADDQGRRPERQLAAPALSNSEACASGTSPAMTAPASLTPKSCRAHQAHGHRVLRRGVAFFARRGHRSRPRAEPPFTGLTPMLQRPALRLVSPAIGDEEGSQVRRRLSRVERRDRAHGRSNPAAAAAALVQPVVAAP